MKKYPFVLAAFLAVHSAVIAGNILRTGQISLFSQQGIGAFSTHIVTFIGLSLLVLTIKQKLWRVGGILAAFSALTRSYMTCFPSQKDIFGIITLVVSLCSFCLLAASWQFEKLDLSWWERRRGKSPTKSSFVIIVILTVMSIFLYWGSRGR